MPFTRRLFVMVVSVVLGATACSSDERSAETRPAGAIDAARVVPSAAAPVAADPESVIVAAMILSTGGDLDAALADGVLTAGDVDAARSGLADGSLDGLFD